ncbi:ATP-dependent nuclease [Streptomyces longwoodensis]|uniref:ATP-dependent nuclease n=1 Tax=Streptomyces longwoodensis TaxID=68231 RepID=UPI0038173848
MRVSSIRLENFQGVQNLHLEDLDNLPLVVISGRNGTGKSTVLVALSLLWEFPDDLDPYPLVGPWGETAKIEMAISLTLEERNSLTEAVRARHGDDVGECPSSLNMGLVFTEYDKPERLESTKWVDILRSKAFRRTHAFARLTFIPSERAVTRSNLGSVDPDSLSSDAAERIRTEAIESVLNRWSRFSLSNIPDYLATLDYAAMIAKRQAEEIGERSEYEEIANSFREATGKELERPSLSREGKIALFVDALNGNKHAIEHLSSGEMEALGLMYMTRRLASAGGILAIDEPEIHLHPSLQTTILDMIRGASESAQLWLCTHSPNLINSSPIDSIVSVSVARADANQATRISHQVNRIELLADLGVTPSSWLQHDRIIIVEGATDQRLIELLFPVEASRSVIYVAGNRAGVDATVRTLTAGEALLPWIAVRDRDLVGNTENDLAKSFTWSRRTFENTFLDSRLLAHVIDAAGGSEAPASVEEKLKELASAEKPDVERLLVEEKLRQMIPDTKPSGTGLKAALEHHISLQQQRLNVYEDATREVQQYLEANWEREWKILVQGKRVLANFTRFTPFRGMQQMLNAICKACRDNPELMPDDLVTLHDIISESTVRSDTQDVSCIPGVLARGIPQASDPKTGPPKEGNDIRLGPCGR